MSDPDYWTDTDPEQLQTYEQRRSILESARAVQEDLTDVEAMLELLDEAEDRSLRKEAQSRLKRLQGRIRSLLEQCFLQGTHARSTAYLSITPGAGGTEAEAWAGKLVEMYEAYVENHDYDWRRLARSGAEQDGVESYLMRIDGAYGWLRGEAGNHRLTRFSPYDDGDTKHTSFAAVDVWPDIPNPAVSLDEEDLSVGTTRSSGPGGQHGDRRETAVSITHEPSGITVQCEDQRSQHANRERAREILKKRLQVRKKREHEQRVQALQDDPSGSWGRRIRSYDKPDDRAVDHRTDVRKGFEQTLDGQLRPFILEYLAQNAPLPGQGW